MSMVLEDVSLFSDTICNNMKIGKYNASREEDFEGAIRASSHDFTMNVSEGDDILAAKTATIFAEKSNTESPSQMRKFLAYTNNRHYLSK